MPVNRLEVYDLTYNKLCILNDNTENGAKNIEEGYKVNSIDTISFVLPLSSDKWQYVLNENLVRWKNEYYFIKVPHFTHNDTTKEVAVECHHLSSGLEGINCPEMNLIGETASNLMEVVLDGTGWTVGTIDVPTDKYRSLIVKEQSTFTNLVKIAELFDAQLTFNSIAKTVDLSDKSENRNIQIRKGKNLQSVDIQYDTTEMVTRLFAFGGDDPITGLEVNIMNVNPSNNSYIEDYSYYLAQGYTQAYIDAHPELFRKEMTWNATEYVDAQALFDDAKTKLTTLCKPKVKCNVEGLDLSIFPEYFIESPVKGETIYILDEDLGLIIDAKVTEIKRQSDKPLGLSITISNEIEYNSIVKQLVDASQTVNKVVNPNNEIRGQYVKEQTITDAHIVNLDAKKINAGDISADRIKAQIIDAINARMNELTADDAIIKTLGANVINAINANITNAKINSAQIDNIDAGVITVDNLKANVIEALYTSIENLTVSDAKVKQLGTDLISSINANITNAKIDSAQIGVLTANNISSGLITSDMIKAGDITVDRLVSNGAGLRFTGFIDINKNQTGATSNGNFAIGGFKQLDGSKIYNNTTTLTMTISGNDYTFTSGKITTDATNKKSYMLMFTTDKTRFTTITGISGTCSNIFAVYRVGTQWYADNGNVGVNGTNGVAFTFNPSTDFIIGTFLFNGSGAIYNWSPMVNAQSLLIGDYFKTGTVDAGVLKAGSIKATSGLFDTTTVFDATAIKMSAGAITTGTLDCANLTVKNMRAESITTGALTIDGDNLIHNTEWLTDTNTWTLTANVTRDTIVKYDTDNTLKISVIGQSTDVYSSAYSEKVSISTGSLVGSIYIETPDYTKIDSLGVKLYIEWFDTNNTRLKQDAQSVTFTTNNTWQRVLLSSVPPNGAVKAWLRICLFRNGTISIARPMLQRGTVASEWKPHTDEQISDGAIDNNKIADNVITGTKLIADAITARELSTQAVKTKVLDADVITSISANVKNITSEQIATSGIQADKIIVGDTGQDIYNYTNTLNTVQTIDGRTDTLFHFDENLCSTNGLNPNDGYVVTMKKNEGKFGGAVAVEEGTTNLVTNPTDPSTWYIATNVNYGYVSHSIIDTEFGVKGISKVIKSVGNGSSATLNNMAWSGTLDVTKPTTISIYARTDTPDGGARLEIDYEGLSASGYRVDVQQEFILDSTTWKRYTLTATLSTNNFVSLSSAIKIYTYTTDGVQRTIDFVCPQLEQKSFATSFVDGTRATGLLTYPITCLNNNEGTIAMWFNPEVVQTDGYPMLMQQDGNIFEWVIRNNRCSINGSYVIPTKNIISNSWYFVVYTWDSNATNKQNLYLYHSDGTVNKAISTAPAPTFSTRGYFSIGTSVTGVYSSNALIDEVFISTRALSDAEIQAMYNLQKPLFDPLPIINPPTPSDINITIL